MKKGRFYEIAPRKAGKFNTWDCVDKALHARKRRILNAAFSDKALKAAEPYIVQHADRWCQLLLDLASDEWSAPKDMAEWSDYLVLDILGKSLSPSYVIKPHEMWLDEPAQDFTLDIVDYC